VAEFARFEEVSSYEELLEAARSARIIYVGDYHALPASQYFQARLLQDLAAGPLILAVEMLYRCDQRALDDWMEGRVDDDRFLRRVRYVTEWGYEWTSFRELLSVARAHGIQVFGIDCAPRNDLRFIHKRDAAVAAKIGELLCRYPEHAVVVSFGESHLATRHLPAKVDACLETPVPAVTILQNVDELYWKVTCSGVENTEVVRIRPGAYCVFNSTPFGKYEAYRRQLEIWDAHDQDEERLDLTSTVYNLIDTIADFIGIDKYRYCLTRQGKCTESLVDAYPEVYSTDEFESFERLLRRSLKKRQAADILLHASRSGSCYVPRVNAIFLGQFSLQQGAEEAAHFVNFALKGQRYENFRVRNLKVFEDFYLTALEEALAYFGSKLIDPRRDQLADSPVLNPDPNGSKAAGHPAWLRKFIVAHKDLEHHYRSLATVPLVISRGLRHNGSVSTLLRHELGYLLGEQLYRGYVSGVLSRREIRRLFETRFEEEKSPMEGYLDLAERLEPLDLG
jgi:hypothetical protein